MNPVEAEENRPALESFKMRHRPDFEVLRWSQLTKDIRAEADESFESNPTTAVARIWKQLCDGLPIDCRATINDRHCILHDKRGVLLASTIRVLYAIRVPASKVQVATDLGLMQSFYWPGIGDSTDLSKQFGKCWFFGDLHDQEVDWVKECYDTFNGAAETGGQSVAHGAAGRADSEINVVRRGPVILNVI